MERRRSEWRQDPIEGLRGSAKALESFCQSVRAAPNRGSSKETALEQAFNRAFFVELLGYRLYPGTEGSWTAWPKPPSSATGISGEPDLVLGTCLDGQFETAAVVELKRPGTPLDAPQPSYSNRTPVEQAFSYARQIDTCRWVLVSDMQFVRLYSIESQNACHEIDLWRQPDQQQDSIAEAYRLIGYANLLLHGTDSPTYRLLDAVRHEQTEYREAFYDIYDKVRADLLAAVELWSGNRFDRQEQVLGLQRLLDRLLFIFFCEDHPDRLLSDGLVEGVVKGALAQPGTSRTKAYDSLKVLFRDLDIGVSTDFYSVPRYNGELFKPHPIVDELTLDDALQSKRYQWKSSGADRRTVRGVFGLHVFDFWRELDRDLLGNLFERSIGDLAAIAHGGRPDARSAFGIFYTASRLARFVAKSAVEGMLSEDGVLTSTIEKIAKEPSKDPDSSVSAVLTQLSKYRVADFTCGSGVFLTAALDALLNPYRKALEAVSSGALTREMYSVRQAKVLKATIFGIDLLPQAVELAKLALWLTAARRNEPSADLGNNFVTGDALDLLTLRQLTDAAGGEFDLVLGNPPWGADYDKSKASEILSASGFDTSEELDSWEVFLCVAVSHLRPNGRFALLVPDTLFSAEKKRIRQWLLEHAQLEKVYALGPDWFTSDVRMGTVIIQGLRKSPISETQLMTLVLAGRERQDAQQGLRPLEQLEHTRGQLASQSRFRADPEFQIQVLASDADLDLLSRIEARSVSLDQLTTHSRGDEINADGLVWHCGGCGAYTVPGEKRRGGRYADKSCPQCDATLSANDAFGELLVSPSQHGHYQTPYIDGSELTRRYESPVRKFIRTDLTNLSPALKPQQNYVGPKILIRQAGVGVVATLVNDDSRVPQSLYIYRATPDALDQGYSNEFLLACLVSRTMNYIVMQKFAEIDPARAFAKLTHARIQPLPIPNLIDDEARATARRIHALTNEMLHHAVYGGEVDLEIELLLRQLWGISGDEGRYINGFFSILPAGQALVDLFPSGAPSRVALHLRPVA